MAPIYTAPLNEYGTPACRQTNCGLKTPKVQLGRTLPSLLDEGCEPLRTPTSPWRLITNGILSSAVESVATVNHRHSGKHNLGKHNRHKGKKTCWQSWTLPELQRAADEIALALCEENEIQSGDRAALLLESNAFFFMADIGSLLAQLVTVPIDPKQPLEKSEYILQETEASVLFVSRNHQLTKLLPILSKLSALRLIVVLDTDPVPVSKNSVSQNTQQQTERLNETRLNETAAALPDTIKLITLNALRKEATWSVTQSQALRAAIHPQDLATIVYTLSPEGQPLGAMLTHENLSGSVLAAFSTLPCLSKGSGEIALSFLPLHHIFARGFVYGSLSFGQTLYFSNPRQVMRHLRELKPGVFLTVPRLLEKIYENWQTASQKPRTLWHYPQYFALNWANRLVRIDGLAALAERRLEPTSTQAQASQAQAFQAKSSWSQWWYKAQLWLARKTVFKSLRQVFGGRLQCFISGGAALSTNVMMLLNTASLKLCQGYGMTEASSTLSFTRRQWNRPGTVGVPMPGVQMRIAGDGEVLVKAPYIMQGYYLQPAATRAVLTPDGWLHTGDKGEFSADGLLTLTGYKKELFKLSIGEYIAPSPIEAVLQQSPLVQTALVVGPGQKFCGALIFPDMDALSIHAQTLGLSTPRELLLTQPTLIQTYQQLINQANSGLPTWATIKQFQLIQADLTLNNARLDWPHREELYLTFSQDIENLYRPRRMGHTLDIPPPNLQLNQQPSRPTFAE